MRLIDADRLMRHLSDWALHNYATEIRECMDAVEEQPTVGPDHVTHGRWIYYDGETIEDGGRCSVCECDQPMFIEDWKWQYVETAYCPHCGARMDEEADHDDHL